MIRLALAIVLCCGAVVSALVFAAQLRLKGRAIKLPSKGSDALNGLAEADDPFED